MLRIRMVADIIVTCSNDDTVKKGDEADLAFKVERKFNDMGYVELDSGDRIGIRVHVKKFYKEAKELYATTNRQVAVKMDRDYYVENQDGIWYVIGSQSGFCYGTYPDEHEADVVRDRMRKENLCKRIQRAYRHRRNDDSHSVE